MPTCLSHKLIVSYPLSMHNENEKLEKNIKHMNNETIQPPETNAQYLGFGPSLLGAEFARCRVC